MTGTNSNEIIESGTIPWTGKPEKKVERRGTSFWWAYLVLWSVPYGLINIFRALDASPDVPYAALSKVNIINGKLFALLPVEDKTKLLP